MLLGPGYNKQPSRFSWTLIIPANFKSSFTHCGNRYRKAMVHKFNSGARSLIFFISVVDKDKKLKHKGKFKSKVVKINYSHNINFYDVYHTEVFN